MTKGKCKCNETRLAIALLVDFIITVGSIILFSIFFHETSIEDFLVNLFGIEEFYANMILTALFAGLITILSTYISVKIATREI